MGKVKPRKSNTDQVTTQQLHEIKGGSIKKNKDRKFKNTPTSKIALINDSKAQDKSVKYISQKAVQKGFADTKNKNQNSPKQISKSNAKHAKQNSPNGKPSFSSKTGKASFKGKLIFDPEEVLEQFDDSSSDSNEKTVSQEDDSLNKTDETFEDEENSDTDVPDIFGKSLGDESDEDDEDFEEEEGEEEEDDGEDTDEEETIEYKGVKMFKGLESKTKKNKDQESDDDDDNDDEDKSDENMTFDESDEYNDEDNEDEDEEEEEDEEKEETEEDDDNDEKQNIKDLNQIDTSLMKTDEDESTDDDDDEDDNDNDDDDDDDDEMDEEIGLKALLGKSIVDDDNDEDFNEEDEEDDEDDDISSEDEDDEENDNTVIQIEAITKEKINKIANKRDIQVEKKKRTFEKEEQWKLMEDKLVLIENISKETTKEKIIELFSQYGDLKQIVLEPLIVYCKNSKKTAAGRTDQVQPKLLSLMGKLLYKTEESALNAVKAMHGTVVDGNFLSVQTLAKFNGPYDAGKTVFITNLKKDVELNEIWKAFHKCGDIDCIELKRNVRTKLCEYGYIHFFTEKAAASAIKLCDIVKVMGHRVIVLGIKFVPDDRDMYRENRYMCREDWDVKKQNEEKQGTKRILSHKCDDKPLKKFKNNLEESVAHDAKYEENVKQKKQQGNSEGKKSTVFQGQKVSLKNKKKKKLDKKKKRMAEKLTAKSAKV